MRAINMTLAAENRKFIINLIIIYEADILRRTLKYKTWTRPKKLALQNIRHSPHKPNDYFTVTMEEIGLYRMLATTHETLWRQYFDNHDKSVILRI
jgi:hypothetical protein